MSAKPEALAEPHGGSGCTYLVAIGHDLFELLVDLLCGPREALRVLGHLEAGDGDTTTVGRF